MPGLPKKSYECLLVLLVALGTGPALAWDAPLEGEFRLDNRSYQDGPFTKFSDWIPHKLHKSNPAYVEDFYELYALKMFYGENEIRRNIFWLQTALKKRFRHPSKALCYIETEKAYHKYRLLVHMQINLSIMRGLLNLGSKYDKRHLRFYNLDFADDLEHSFARARYFYQAALPFWREAKRLANEASRYRFSINLPTIESKRFQMVTGELDYDRIIRQHLYKVERKIETVKAFLDKEGRPRPVKKWMAEIEDPQLKQSIQELHSEHDKTHKFLDELANDRYLNRYRFDFRKAKRPGTTQEE